MKITNIFLYSTTALVLLLILGPLSLVILTSFSAADFFSFPPQEFSLRWYREFFATPSMRNAFWLSVYLAVGTSVASIVLGVMAAVFVSRRQGSSSGWLQSLFMAPLVFPTIILGLALLLCYRMIGMPTLAGLALAHILIGLPYCFRATLSSLQSFDVTLEEAGASLGASPIRTFLLVTLPLIWPGVISGWLFAFIVSFGELNASLFLTGPGVTTLPIEIFSYLQFQGSQLVIAAASALQVGLILLLVFAVERAIGLGRIVRS